MAPILNEAGVLHKGIEVVFIGSDEGEEEVRGIKMRRNFARSMSVADAMNPINILCYEVNGEALTATAQDRQACKPESDYSFSDVKAAMHRVTSSRMYSGWDEKTFNGSGDLVAVAVLNG